MGPPMWPWRYGLTARPVSGVEWSGGMQDNMYYTANAVLCLAMHSIYSTYKKAMNWATMSNLT